QSGGVGMRRVLDQHHDAGTTTATCRSRPDELQGRARRLLNVRRKRRDIRVVLSARERVDLRRCGTAVQHRVLVLETYQKLTPQLIILVCPMRPRAARTTTSARIVDHDLLAGPERIEKVLPVVRLFVGRYKLA